MVRPSTHFRDIKIMESYQAGQTPKLIAEAFSMTIWAVYKAIKRIPTLPYVPRETSKLFQSK